MPIRLAPWVHCLLAVGVLAGCSSETAIDAQPNATSSALTAGVADGWAQYGFLLARMRLDVVFDNTAGAQPAVARVDRVEWQHVVFDCHPGCPDVSVPAGEIVEWVVERGLDGGDAFLDEPDCADSDENSTTTLEVQLVLDGAQTTLSAEVAEYCLRCDEDLTNCESIPSDPPE